MGGIGGLTLTDGTMGTGGAGGNTLFYILFYTLLLGRMGLSVSFPISSTTTYSFLKQQVLRCQQQQRAIKAASSASPPIIEGTKIGTKLGLLICGVAGVVGISLETELFGVVPLVPLGRASKGYAFTDPEIKSNRPIFLAAFMLVATVLFS